MAKFTKDNVKSCMKSSALTLATLLGVIGGVVFGLLLRQREEKWTEREVIYVSYVGKLFLRMLKALILPLIVPSLIAAVGSLDMSLSGKVGGRAVGYYMSTTVLAVILGIILVTSIHPGTPKEAENDIKKVGESRNVTAADTLMDLARNMVPPNLIQATIMQYRTVLTYPGVEKYNDGKQVRDPNDLYTWKISGEFTNGTNILGLVFFAVILGITLAQMEEKREAAAGLFQVFI
ncbi:Excitatory amino acid transporter 3 [Lepeophtheirus salmonis]|uniref:Amino acid transporter n=1 Tax=Lepeophtheirus salmonis TaxID=72036 RepID=A0A7R8CWV9_LEPSM|nr:Excitatory amino acid transporter 3 [Lepeophtheirus salmonis]CAF2907275.1 Excitatory amino acid transporter 3 [Lepeophtheirus salmonis]